MKFLLFPLSLAAFTLFVITLLTGCRSTWHIPAVSTLNLERYMGKWYEIARLPNFFENGMSRISTEYLLTPDNSITVVNSGIEDGQNKNITGTARLATDVENGELEVSFFGPFYNAYRIIKLPQDYRYSVVCGASPDYLWILSRTPELSAEDRQEILDFLTHHQFPVEDLIWEESALSQAQ